MQPNQPKRARRDGKIAQTPPDQNTFISPGPGNSNQSAASSTSRQPRSGASERRIASNKVAGNIIQDTQPLTLVNRNNSCFINCVLQVLFSIPEFKQYITTFSGSPVLQPVTTVLDFLNFMVLFFDRFKFFLKK